VKQWLQWLEHWLGGGPGGKKRVNTIRWLLLVGLVGLAIMILNSYMHVKDADSLSGIRSSPIIEDENVFGSKEKEASEFEEYEGRYEAKMKDILTRIVGVGELDVMITIDSTEELVIEHNTQQTQQETNEKDRDGGSRHISNITRNGEVVLYQVSGEQTPIILRKIKPKIRGVLVVANGAENLTVKKLITQAVERGLGVPPHRISVIPRKQ
jgi:stage III sporulation protein AG